MLRDEDGMAFPGRLLAVVGRMRRRESLRDEVARVLQDERKTFLAQVLRISRAELLRRPEAGLRQLREQLVQIAQRQSFTSPLGVSSAMLTKLPPWWKPGLKFTT